MADRSTCQGKPSIPVGCVGAFTIILIYIYIGAKNLEGDRLGDRQEFRSQDLLHLPHAVSTWYH